MTQNDRLLWLIRALLAEDERYSGMDITTSETEQKRLLRALMNVRAAKPVSEEFLHIQDEYLQSETAHKGITDILELEALERGIYLWQGDITTLRCGAIVNAANSGMTGCYAPNHGCIDNAIHTYAGIQLRLECDEIMRAQGHSEGTGLAKLTKAYNLPCDHVLHTVGPIIFDKVTEKHKELLASCYRSCLELAHKNEIKSVAFCCISTGEFRFPNELAAIIAVETVREYLKEHNYEIEVVFNVYKDVDLQIYRKLLR